MEVESIDEGVIGKIFVEGSTEGVKVECPHCGRFWKRLRRIFAISSKLKPAKVEAIRDRERQAKTEVAPASAPAPFKK